jgi:hypothetical protein
MEELHTDSIDGGLEASYGLGHVPGRGRTPTYFLCIYPWRRGFRTLDLNTIPSMSNERS